MKFSIFIISFLKPITCSNFKVYVLISWVPLVLCFFFFFCSFSYYVLVLLIVCVKNYKGCRWLPSSKKDLLYLVPGSHDNKGHSTLVYSIKDWADWRLHSNLCEALSSSYSLLFLICSSSQIPGENFRYLPGPPFFYGPWTSHHHEPAKSSAWLLSILGIWGLSGRKIQP